MLEAAGLPITMGNAVREVKEICRATVADCNHSGVAEAIDRYLLTPRHKSGIKKALKADL